MSNSVDPKALDALVKEYTKDAPEVYEVCQYAMHSATSMMMALGAQSHSELHVPHIPPESILLMHRYAAGTVKNSFYHENFAPISNAIAQDHLLSKVMFSAVRHADQKPEAKVITRDLIANRYGALSTIIFLHRGHDDAFAFLLKLKHITRATDSELAMFK